MSYGVSLAEIGRFDVAMLAHLVDRLTHRVYQVGSERSFLFKCRSISRHGRLPTHPKRNSLRRFKGVWITPSGPEAWAPIGTPAARMSGSSETIRGGDEWFRGSC